MAERQVALVPTMLQLDNFERYAEQGQARFPRYAAHMRALYARRLDTFAAAHDAGVPIYAGTDAGGDPPHGLVAQEIAALAPILGPEGALAAGSWAARRWLGRPGALVDGAPADLIVLDADPRRDLAVLRSPRLRHPARSSGRDRRGKVAPPGVGWRRHAVISAARGDFSAGRPRDHPALGMRGGMGAS